MLGNQMHNLKTLKRNRDIVVQRMKEEDINQVVLIEQESFSDPWSKQSFLGDLKNPSTLSLVVKLGQEVVGYACLWQMENELQIGNIAVAKKHRRKGIGNLLMKQIVDEATKRECQLILLDVRESNRVAISLYKKFGFVHLNRRKSHYRLPKEDALIMFKPL